MAVKAGGVFRLVKVNSDNERPVSAALEVTALPTVFGVRDGKIQHMFQVSFFQLHTILRKRSQFSTLIFGWFFFSGNAQIGRIHEELYDGPFNAWKELRPACDG